MKYKIYHFAYKINKNKILLAHYDLRLNIIGTYIYIFNPQNNKMFFFYPKICAGEKFVNINVNTARTRTSTRAL